MSRETTSQGFTSNRTLLMTIGAVVVVAGISYAMLGNQMGSSTLNEQPYYEVEEGPLTVSITVAGTVQAREKVIIKNELEGNSTILFLTEEGAQVQQGDLLVELDASSLIDQRVDQQISVQNAEASFINSRENLAIAESQARSDIDQAQLAFDFAKMDLVKYQDAEYPQLEKTALSEITKMEEELKLAEEELRWSEILYSEKYIALSQLQGDELAVSSLQLSLDVRKNDLDMLQNYTYQRQIAQLESDVEQAEMSLERTKRQANANIVQASADLQAKKAELDQQIGKLQKLDDQISKAKIYAPMDGLVVYHTSVEMNWRGNNEPLDEGQTVRERQELIHLPTTSSFMVESKVQESSLEKIRVGLPVRVTVDAIPNKVFTGRVASIAPLPNAQSVFMNPDLKEYDTVIYIEGDSEELRSGMGCQAEIIVDFFESTTYVPVQSIIRVGNQPTVFVYEGDGFNPRPVELGPDNNRLAQIPSGLNPGDQVLLTPPLSYAEVTDEERYQEATSVQEVMQNAQLIQTQLSGEGRAGNRGEQSPGGAVEQGAGEGRRQMTDEQREQMRQRFQNMSPEERDRMRQPFQGGGGGERGGAPQGRGPGQ